MFFPFQVKILCEIRLVGTSQVETSWWWSSKDFCSSSWQSWSNTDSFSQRGMYFVPCFVYLLSSQKAHVDSVCLDLVGYEMGREILTLPPEEVKIMFDMNMDFIVSDTKFFVVMEISQKQNRNSMVACMYSTLSWVDLFLGRGSINRSTGERVD